MIVIPKPLISLARVFEGWNPRPSSSISIRSIRCMSRTRISKYEPSRRPCRTAFASASPTARSKSLRVRLSMPRPSSCMANALRARDACRVTRGKRRRRSRETIRVARSPRAGALNERPPFKPRAFTWQGGQDSNLQPTVLETATLPIAPPPSAAKLPLFAVRFMTAAPTAIFAQLQPLGRLYFIFERVVVASLAFGASQRHHHAILFLRQR